MTRFKAWIGNNWRNIVLAILVFVTLSWMAEWMATLHWLIGLVLLAVTVIFAGRKGDAEGFDRGVQITIESFNRYAKQALAEIEAEIEASRNEYRTGEDRMAFVQSLLEDVQLDAMDAAENRKLHIGIGGRPGRPEGRLSMADAPEGVTTYAELVKTKEFAEAVKEHDLRNLKAWCEFNGHAYKTWQRHVKRFKRFTNDQKPNA